MHSDRLLISQDASYCSAFFPPVMLVDGSFLGHEPFNRMLLKL